MKCVICQFNIGAEGPSQFAAFGGLPSPCCINCFEANDYTCKTTDDVRFKSIARRRRLGLHPFDKIAHEITQAKL
jgi:hypothetical protein